MKINKEENIIKDHYFDKFVKKAKRFKFYIDYNRAVLITESYKATDCNDFASKSLYPVQSERLNVECTPQARHLKS